MYFFDSLNFIRFFSYRHFTQRQFLAINKINQSVLSNSLPGILARIQILAFKNGVASVDQKFIRFVKSSRQMINN